MNTGDWVVFGMAAWIVATFPLLIGIGRWMQFCSDREKESQL